MRVVVQRVAQASVKMGGNVVSKIGKGYLLLVGLKEGDGISELAYMARKVARLRIFSDEQDKMNLSIAAVGGQILSVSQFTLYGDSSQSNRPSFTAAMAYDKAYEMYQIFNRILREEYHLEVYEGVFGEQMAIDLTNEGPVTIILEK